MGVDDRNEATSKVHVQVERVAKAWTEEVPWKFHEPPLICFICGHTTSDDYGKNYTEVMLTFPERLDIVQLLGAHISCLYQVKHESVVLWPDRRVHSAAPQ